MLERWGNIVGAQAWPVLVTSVAVGLVAAVFGIGVFGGLSDGGFGDPDSESAQELTAERQTFANHGSDVVAIYSSDDDSARVGDPAFKRAVTDVVSGLPDDAVTRVTSYYATGSADLVSEDGRSTMVVISLAGDSEDAKSANYDAVRPHLEADGLTTKVGGQWAVFDDVNETVSADIARAESIAMPVVFALSLVIFGSLVAAVMPVLVGTFAVFGAFAVVRLISSIGEVSVFAINVITLIGMGLAIDYALFIVSRFKEEMGRGEMRGLRGRDQVNAAVSTTMRTAGRTVLFSGLTVAASLASLLIFPQDFLQSMAYGGVAAVLVAMVAALTVLPAVLALLGHRIDAGRMPWLRRRSSTAGLVTGHGAWARIAHSVMRRPVAYLSVTAVALVALGTPFLGVSWGSVDHRVLPDDAPSHVAAETRADEFGGATSSAQVVVTGADRQALDSYVHRLDRLDRVDSARVVDHGTRGGEPAGLVSVGWDGGSQSQASQEVVKSLRQVDPGAGATALVGGQSAQTVDLVDSLGDHLPWMGVLVVAVMLGLLFLAFGSVVLPVKAVMVNAVSLAASFGVVTWIFADGHLSDMLGFTPTGYLDATQPILMLGILFGLSMDYEVFLLSRVREEWDRTHDNTSAVAFGLQRSGRIITSAALLLAVVVGGFATSDIVFMKMIGVGMLVALLLDATVVRALMVPATMRLLGRVNWWAPRPLRRWWERHGVHEAADEPTESEPVRVG